MYVCALQARLPGNKNLRISKSAPIYVYMHVHLYIIMYEYFFIAGCLGKEFQDFKEYSRICIHVYINVYKYMITYEYIFIAGCLGKKKSRI